MLEHGSPGSNVLEHGSPGFDVLEHGSPHVGAHLARTVSPELLTFGSRFGC